MFSWRISKYDPALRNENGAYLKDEWTMISQIGKTFDGRIFNFDDYLKTENEYISTVLNFLAEAQLDSLKISALERQNLTHIRSEILVGISTDTKFVRNGEIVSGARIKDICRFVLREVVWCRLESPSGFFVHFGWDYYVYLGSPRPSNSSIAYGKAQNLYIEEMTSPYMERES